MDPESKAQAESPSALVKISAGRVSSVSHRINICPGVHELRFGRSPELCHKFHVHQIDRDRDQRQLPSLRFVMRAGERDNV
jgi:hypothetical protein